MECYVISAEVAARFRQFLFANDAKFIRTVRDAAEILPCYDNRELITRIKMAVCRKYLGAINLIDSRSQARDIVHARRVAWYLVRKMAGLSLPQIGRDFGYHHTSVLYGIEKLEQQMQTDQKLNEEVESLQREILDLQKAG